jgi:RHS repeat-associated protein
MLTLGRSRSFVLVLLVGLGAALLLALALGGAERVGLAGGAGAAPVARTQARGGGLSRLGGAGQLVSSASSRSSSTYRLADGTMRTRVSPVPVNFRDGQGRWRPIDATLIARRGVFVNRAGAHRVQLPQRLSRDVRVSSGSDRLSMRLLGADGAVAVRGARARYPDVLPGVSAVYDSQAQGLREQLVLADRSAPERFVFALSASPGLRARQSHSGEVVFSRGARQVFVLPAAFAFAQGDEGETHAVGSVLRRSARGWTLTVSANHGWVHHALRRGPVVVDPTVIVDPDSQDCTIESDTPTTSYCSSNSLIVGYDARSPAHDHRSLVQFDVSTLPRDAVVLNATLELYLGGHSTSNLKQVGAYRVLRPWTNSMTWNKYDATNSWTSPGAANAVDALTTPESVRTIGDTINDWVDWYPTKTVQGWVDGSIANRGLLMHDVTPNTTDNELGFASADNDSSKPNMEIEWAPRTGQLGSYTFDSQRLSDRASLAVNVANGNLLLSNDDVHVAGTGLDLDVTHFHNSLGAGFGLQGVGIAGTASLGEDVHLQVFADGTVAYAKGDGVVLPFLDRSVSGSTASFLSPPDLNATLTQNTSTGVYTLTFNRSEVREIFNSSGQLTQVKDRNDNAISLGYDPDGKGLEQITDTQGREYAVGEYGDDGDIASITDPTDRTWSYTYGHDDTNYLTDYQDPSGHHTLYDYDTSHRLNTITTPKGNVTKITYDGTSNRVATVKRTTDAGHTTGPTTSYAYSTGSPCTTGQNKTVVTDPNSHNITYCADAVNDRVAKALDADGRTRSTSYKPNGDVDTGTSAGSSTLPGFDTAYTYSSSNSPTQRVRTTGTGGSPTTLTDSATYNATGSGCSPAATWLNHAPDTTTDAQGNVTTYGRDCNGNLTSVRDTLTVQNQITLGSIDSKGNPHTISDANGNTTSLGYDTAGRLTSTTPPTTAAPSTQLGATAITYDALSRTDTVTDGKGQDSTLAYDDLDRVTQVTYDDGSTVANTYDADGNVTERDETAGGVTKVTGYTYDKLNRLTREDFPDGTSNAYGYDDVGNLTSLQDASGTTAYAQENANLLSGETEPGAGTSYAFAYDGNAFRTSTTFPNGVVQTLSHDGIGRITHIVDKKGTTTLKDLTYSYIRSVGGDSEQLRTLTDNVSSEVTTYSYDVLNRLTDAWTKNGSSTVRRYQYTLDGNGNIIQRVVTVGSTATTTTYVYNQTNQLCWAYTGTSSNSCGSAPSGATTYTYDANGNQTGTANPSTSSSYNAKDRTTSLLGMSMGYLGDGQTELITDGTATLHNSILDTTSRTVSGTTDYFTRDDKGLLLADRASSSTKYYLLDPLSSVIATTNSTGSVSASYAYDPYGASIATAPSPFGYTSGYRTTSGLYHYGARYYNPTDQRWTQQDPVGQAADLTNGDAYAYAGGDPVNATDPSGCKPRIPACLFNCMIEHCNYNDAIQCVYNAKSGREFITCVARLGCGGKFLKCVKDNCRGGGPSIKIGPFRIPIILS